MATRSRSWRDPVPGVAVDAFRATRRARWMAGVRDRVTLGSVDGWLLAILAGLCAFGLVMVYSASEALGYAWYGNPSYFFQRQLLWLAIGLGGLVVTSQVDYRTWSRHARTLGVVALVLLLAVLMPHLGTERLGARRWLGIGQFSFQPSQVATFVAIVWFSRWLVERGPAIRRGGVVAGYAVLLGTVLLLVVAERDLGSAIVLAGIGLVVLTLGGARLVHVALLAAGLFVLGFLAVTMEAYRASRLQAFRDPFSDPLNHGFQTVQALYALGSGGFGGVGLGNSIQKYQWLPEAHTDFIFAISGEELGLVGTVGIVAAFLVFAWRGTRAALRAPDAFGSILAGGITAWVSVQAFVNMAAVTNLVPTTGITLPFISYGGSSLAMTLVAAGVLCNISAQGRRHSEARRAHLDRWRGNRRASQPGDSRRPGAARR